MTKEIIKRDGRFVDFDSTKIFLAVIGAINEAQENGEIVDNAEHIASEVEQCVVAQLESMFDSIDICPTVEQIQDLVVSELEEAAPVIANYYQRYRDRRTKERSRNTDLMKKIKRISEETERDNANVGNNFSAKLLQIASISNQSNNLLNLPEHIAKAHENGDIHIHDLDSYQITINCLNLDTGNILKRGFNVGYGTINPPKRIDSAAALSCIVLQSSQNDCFGGQNHTNFDNDMADFIEPTRKYVYDELKDCFNFNIDHAVNKITEKRIRQAMQTIVYNLNSMASRAGSQVPFSGVCIGTPKNEEAALICKTFLEEYNKGLGKGEQPIFPNIAFRLKKGVNVSPEDPYFYLTELACRVAAHRMNPTFINCDASMNLPLYEKGLWPARMGCRTNIASNVNGAEGPNRRGNIAPVSINLPRLAILASQSKNKIEKFAELFDKIIDLCEEQLLHRYKTLKKLKGKDLPFVIGQKLIMGSEEVGPEDSIEPVLKNGTWAIGFIGLAEAMTCLFGEHHGEDAGVHHYAYKVIERLRERCDEMTKKHKLNFTCYATPAEGLSGRFVKMDQKKFGIIKGVTNKDYYTNSFHIPVKFNISIKDKATLESPFHKLCNAGHITYFEFDRPPANNWKVLLKTVQHVVNETDIGYFGFNFGEVYCKDDGTKHIQGNTCPTCGGTNLQGISRVTGYLSLNERFSPGKVAERKDRISHNTK